MSVQIHSHNQKNHVDSLACVDAVQGAGFAAPTTDAALDRILASSDVAGGSSPSMPITIWSR